MVQFIKTHFTLENVMCTTGCVYVIAICWKCVEVRSGMTGAYFLVSLRCFISEVLNKQW